MKAIVIGFTQNMQLNTAGRTQRIAQPLSTLYSLHCNESIL